MNDEDSTTTNLPNAIVIVLLLGGLPGAGKSCVSRRLHERILRGNLPPPPEQRIRANTADDDDPTKPHQNTSHDPTCCWLDSCHVIEYDQLQQQQQQQRNDRNKPEDTIQAWRQARVEAVQALQEQLQQHDDDYDDDVPTTATQPRRQRRPPSNQPQPPKRHLIVLDDNFHLRSMRHDIYQVCFRHQQAIMQHEPKPETTMTRNNKDNDNDSDDNNDQDGAATLYYFCVAWLDTPLDLCVQRNQERALSGSATAVEPAVLEKLHQSAQPPPVPAYPFIAPTVEAAATTAAAAASASLDHDHPRGQSPWWEQQASLRLDGTLDVETNVDRLLYWLQHHVLLRGSGGEVPSLRSLVQWTHTRQEQEQAQRAQQEQDRIWTRTKDVRHQTDQHLRACVQCVARIEPSWAAVANQVRQAILQPKRQTSSRRSRPFSVAVPKAAAEQQQQPMPNSHGDETAYQGDLRKNSSLPWVCHQFLNAFAHAVSDPDAPSVATNKHPKTTTATTRLWTEEVYQELHDKIDATLSAASLSRPTS